MCCEPRGSYPLLPAFVGVNAVKGVGLRIEAFSLVPCPPILQQDLGLDLQMRVVAGMLTAISRGA